MSFDGLSVEIEGVGNDTIINPYILFNSQVSFKTLTIRNNKIGNYCMECYNGKIYFHTVLFDGSSLSSGGVYLEQSTGTMFICRIKGSSFYEGFDASRNSSLAIFGFFGFIDVPDIEYFLLAYLGSSITWYNYYGTEGTFTGQKYFAETNSVISTYGAGASSIPGTIAGTADSTSNFI